MRYHFSFWSFGLGLVVLRCSTKQTSLCQRSCSDLGEYELHQTISVKACNLCRDGETSISFDLIQRLYETIQTIGLNAFKR